MPRIANTGHAVGTECAINAGRVVNAAQAVAWNGDEGLHWADHHDRWNGVNDGFNAPLLDAAAIAESDRVLDIGCGAGRTTRLAARRAHCGRAIGVDLSTPMLERARALAADEGLADVAFEKGDAQVHPFPAGAFDVAISRFGIMFFADPVAAFANIGRALRPGGRLAFVCMAQPDRNEWTSALSVLRDVVPAGPEGRAPAETGEGPGMFSLADPDHIRRTLTAAGFDAVAATLTEAPTRWGADAEDAAAFALGAGPARYLLAQADRASAARARDALVAAFRPYEHADGVRLRGAAWLVTARRP